MYKWDINEIKKNIIALQRQLESTSNPVEELEIENKIYALEDLIDYYNQEICHSKSARTIYIPEGFREIIADDLKLTKEFGYYFSIIRSFSESFDYSKIRPQDLPSRMSSPNPKIVALTSAFYKKQSEIFQETYAKLSSHFTTRLNFNKPNANNSLDGETKPIYGTNLVYININKSNTIRDYVTMIHESSHGMAYLLNDDVIWDDQKYCFRELDSLFFELIGIDYIDTTLSSPIDCQQIKVATFKDYLYSADLITSKADMYNSLSRQDLKNRKAVTTFLKQEIGYDKIGVKDVMRTYSKEYFHYIISYLTAIELYLIYQVDQDFALELLYKIIMFKDMNNQAYLAQIRKLGIEPGKNIEEYFKKLVDADRKLCYGKNIQL